MGLPVISPPTTGWLRLSTPAQHLGEGRHECPSCEQVTRCERFSVTLAPAPQSWLARLLARSGPPVAHASQWGMCVHCRSMLPLDPPARAAAAQHGRPHGFLN